MDVVRVEARHAESAHQSDDEARDATVQATSDTLPHPEGAFDLVVIDAMLEFYHDDRKLVDELARVSRVGGQLVARLPRRGRLAALDALNLYRYVSELTGRSDILPEAEPIGWRRHYEESDLTAVFATSGLVMTNIERGGYGLGEAAYLPGLIATRAIADRPWAAQRLRDWYDRFGDLDERLPGPATFVVTAVKSASSDPVEPAGAAKEPERGPVTSPFAIVRRSK